MEVNYSYYDIDIADIWYYERELFLYGENGNTVLAKNIINKVQHIITTKGTPSFSFKEYQLGDEKFRDYYKRNADMYRKACESLKELYRIDYFIATKGSCFEYSESIVIDLHNENFDFWFALKLRQYNDKIIAISDFLNFHLKYTFNDNMQQIVDFLKLSCRQYLGLIFENKIIETVNEWSEEKTKNKKLRSNKSKPKMKGEIHSFLLQKSKYNLNYYRKSGNREIFREALSALKNEKFISKKTSLEIFISIFCNQKITEKNRIIWIGTKKELSWLVFYLIESDKIYDLKNNKWMVAINCFVDGYGLPDTEIKDFERDQLRNASDGKLDRKILLESILSKL
ncbi:hypothetical protein [Flavivirga eckloniae]|uniref:Uncharacterized protein n=1 Tax=Flavivirga eckloniae TaxID=1803846 RepID=A0A2K9PVX0_9FLAO|nr:hypothetical protein [Flavivirga eckloniae]AUP81219.1 hypothetical protein C1H87_21880 [Flavivirga eckloniae]